MVHRALEVSDELANYSIDAGVVDLYRLKPVNVELLLETIGEPKGLVTLEEHLLAGGLGSIIAEILLDNDKTIPLKRIGVQDKYYYAYGGRNHIQRLCGLDRDSIIKTLLEWSKLH